MNDGLPRAVNVLVAAAALGALAPVLATIAALVKASSRGPVLFRQTRVGRCGSRFVLLKFRTMRDDASGPSITTSADARVTPIGRALRATKLDELPQLVNVVRGDMALVGPRPEVPRFIDLDDADCREMLSVLPGLTDPVSLALRREGELLARADDPERFYRDVLLPLKRAAYARYVRTRSPLGDAAILAKTALALLGLRRVPAATLDDVRRALQAQ